MPPILIDHLKKHQEHLPQRYQLLSTFEDLPVETLNAIFQALPAHLQAAYRASLRTPNSDTMPNRMEGSVPRNGV
jgi:hypothetical protein